MGPYNAYIYKKRATIQRGPEMAKWLKIWHRKIQKNILYQIAILSFIHISNRLAAKHKKSDWPLGGATYQKNKKYKNVQKYSLSYWYYGVYSYLQPFIRETQKVTGR